MLFRKSLIEQRPQWQELVSYPPRLKNGAPDVVRFIRSPIPDPDGFRLLWFHSSAKQERDVANRAVMLARTIGELECLKAKVEGPRSRFTTQEGIAERVDQILKHRGADRWITYRIDTVSQEIFRQERRGRSGSATRYRRIVKTRFTLGWTAVEKNIEEDAQCDGVFPLLTNCMAMPVLQILEAYRRKQPLIEKRHELLKTVLRAAPVYLKNVGRVEAFLLVEYIALTVHALIERDIRSAMTRRGLKELLVYPEDRECRAPTANRIFECFAPLQYHRFIKGKRATQVFPPELTPLQQQICELLSVPATRFGEDLR
jgi:hypothetical protein